MINDTIAKRVKIWEKNGHFIDGLYEVRPAQVDQLIRDVGYDIFLNYFFYVDTKWRKADTIKGKKEVMYERYKLKKAVK